MPKEKEKEKEKTKPAVKKSVKKTAAKKPVKEPVKKATVKKPVEKKEVKEPVKKTAVKKVTEVKAKLGPKELWATGKRKTSVAQVHFFASGKEGITVNKKTVKEYFPLFELKEMVLSPLKLLKKEKSFRFIIRVHGGGFKSQAEATRLGIARALITYNIEWRKKLKPAGYLRRDPRKKERKKPGLKRARRAPQWAKR